VKRLGLYRPLTSGKEHSYQLIWYVMHKGMFHVERNGLLRRVAEDGFGGLVVSMLASGTQVCGFKPGRSRWIFRL
jgi:hypothetical protein